MKTLQISKYPIEFEGILYKVSITEYKFNIEHYYEIKIYSPIKFLCFNYDKKVDSITYYEGSDTIKRLKREDGYIDLISLTKEAFKSHKRNLERTGQEQKRKENRCKNLMKSVKDFEAWNGKITN